MAATPDSVVPPGARPYVGSMSGGTESHGHVPANRSRRSAHGGHVLRRCKCYR